MKVNVISDIHATLDNDKKVIYNLPFAHKHEKYIKTIEILKSYFETHFDEIKTFSLDFGRLHNIFPETIVIKTHADMLAFIDKLLVAVTNKFAGVSKDEMFDFSRALSNIEEFCGNAKINWRYKTKALELWTIRNFMFKCLYDFDPAKLEPADVLIIAGDLGIEPIYDMVLEDIKSKTAGKFKKVLSIAGNHDHWWCRIEGIAEEKPDHVNLDHDYCEWVDGDYAFIGCTMWTPISERDVWVCGRNMNDYYYTPGKFSPYASSHQFEIQSAWLRSKIAQYNDKKIVVFTHHQPFEELTLDDYKHNGGWDNVNAAYVVLDHSLDDINENGNIKLWCCGHTHQCYDGILHNTHVVRNPIGYRDITGFSYSTPENMSGTWYNKIIEV